MKIWCRLFYQTAINHLGSPPKYNMKQLLVSSLISLTLLNSGISFTPHTTTVSDNGNTELKQIITVSDYNPKPLDLGISKISTNLEKIQQTETRKIEDQIKLDEENRLREEQKQQQIAEQQKQEAEEAARKRALAKLIVAAPKPQAATITPSGDVQSYAKNRICEVFGCDQWDAYYFIIEKESHWNYQAINKSSGAGGLCQALPFSKMASKGSDYTTNPNTQTEWCISYIQGRYKTPAGAKAFWNANNWF